MTEFERVDYDVVPKDNIHIPFLRNTLVNNGADWSNAPVPNVNYLPNYFNEWAKINKWSRNKPLISDKHELTDRDKEFLNWGIKIPVYTVRDALYDDYINNRIDDVYKLPVGGSNQPFRMSDYRGYYPLAKNPVMMQNIDEIQSNGTTYFNTITSIGSDYEVGFQEIYPKDCIYTMVRVSGGGTTVWATSPVVWSSRDFLDYEGEVEVFTCMTNRQITNNEPPSGGDVVAPIFAENNPYKALMFKKDTRPYYLQVSHKPIPNTEDIEFTIRVFVNKSGDIPEILLGLTEIGSDIGIDSQRFKPFYGEKDEVYYRYATLSMHGRLGAEWYVVCGDFRDSGFVVSPMPPSGGGGFEPIV